MTALLRKELTPIKTVYELTSGPTASRLAMLAGKTLSNRLEDILTTMVLMNPTGDVAPEQ